MLLLGLLVSLAVARAVTDIHQSGPDAVPRFLTTKKKQSDPRSLNLTVASWSVDGAVCPFLSWPPVGNRWIFLSTGHFGILVTTRTSLGRQQFSGLLWCLFWLLFLCMFVCWSVFFSLSLLLEVGGVGVDCTETSYGRYCLVTVVGRWLAFELGCSQLRSNSALISLSLGAGSSLEFWLLL